MSSLFFLARARYCARGIDRQGEAVMHLFYGNREVTASPKIGCALPREPGAKRAVRGRDGHGLGRRKVPYAWEAVREYLRSSTEPGHP